MEPHRRLEHVLVVDGDDERRRPDLPRRQRNRSADQPQADDADLLEDRRCPSRRAGLDNGEFHDDCRFRLQIAIRDETQIDSRSQCGICNCSSIARFYDPQPRRATGSRQMLRPMAGAMIRSSAISRSNCAGNIDCAPSLSA